MIAPLITAIERIDDIPLLLAQMRKLQLAELLDNQFPMHGNWEGLSLGNIVQVWLAYILSEGDHRLNHVESWAEGLLVTLKKCLGRDVVSLDFSDDRLSRVVDFLGQDEPWDTFEGNLGQILIRVYDLKPKRARIDSTTAEMMLKVFRGVTRMEVTPLNPVQEKILMLLEQPKCIYTELYMNPIEPTNNLSER